MSVSVRALAVTVAAIACLVAVAAPARAQIAQLEGRVFEVNSKNPIAGAVVDIFRTDQKGKYETKTDENGRFTYPVPGLGTYSIVVSAPGRAARFAQGIRPAAGLKPMEFYMDPGDGGRPTPEQIEQAATSKAAAPSAEEVAEYEKQVKLKEQFDVKKAHFDTGVKALQGKQYDQAITEFTASLEGLDENVDPKVWGELIGAAGGNLAEMHYRVAVDDFNSGKKDEAKRHLEQAARVMKMVTKVRPTDASLHSLQGKVTYLLVDKFSMQDQAETGAAAYLKASELETADKKAKIDYLVKAGDTYRAGYDAANAIETYKKALALDPNNLSALYGIGLAGMTASGSDAELKQMYQMAADYLKAFADKAGSDPRADDAKGILATLAADFKIKPRPIK